MKLKFEAQLLIVTILAYGFGFGVWPTWPGGDAPTFWYWIPAYFLILFYLVFRWVAKAIARNPRQFVNAFMGGTTVKMLTSIAVLIVFIYNNEAQKFPFAVSFMSLYMIYLALDVMALLKESAKSHQ